MLFSLNRGVAQPGSAPAWGAGGPRFKSGRPDHILVQAVNTPHGVGVNSFFDSSESPRLEDLLSAFIYSSVHKSPKTIKTLHETLNPFVGYLKRIGIDCYLAINTDTLRVSSGKSAKGVEGNRLARLVCLRSLGT